MDRRRLLALIGGSTLAIAIGAGMAQAADRSVAISGFTFSPRNVTVNVGDTVTWTNSDAQAHTATSGSDWNTGDIANGESASITFRTTGTFDYICAIHPQMTGRVVVQAGTAPPTDTKSVSGAKNGTPRSLTLLVLAAAAVVVSTLADRRFRQRSSGR
jgi:plastocyanin